MGHHLNQGVVFLALLLIGCTTTDGVTWIDTVTEEGSPTTLSTHRSADRSGVGEVFWFEIETAELARQERPAIYLTSAGSNVAVYLDEQWVFGEPFTDRPMAHTWNTPYLIPIEREALRRSEKLRIGIFSFPGGHALLSPFAIGDYRTLAPTYRAQKFVQIELAFVASVCAFLLAALFLMLWFSSRGEREFLYAGAASLSFGFANLNFHLAYHPLSHWWWSTVVHTAIDWLTVFCILWLLEDRKIKTRFTRVVWGWGILSLAINIFTPGPYTVPVVEYLHVGSAVLFFGAFVFTAQVRAERSRFETVAMAATTFVGFSLCAFDLLVQFQWIDRAGLPRFTPFAFFFLLLSASVLLLRRFLVTFQSAQRSNAELTELVEQKEQRIAQQYDQLKELETKKARAEERTHLLREIHDGMGGHLVSALALSERESTGKDVPNALRSALGEMRLLVDSTGPDSNNLGVALGSIRERIEPAIERAGLTLNWEMDPFAETPQLSPRDVLNVVRFVQESVTNALKHANATEITIAMTIDDDRARVTIRDNGIGYQGARDGGRGLKNMRFRAEQLGGEMSLKDAKPGTAVILAIPS